MTAAFCRRSKPYRNFEEKKDGDLDKKLGIKLSPLAAEKKKIMDYVEKAIKAYVDELKRGQQTMITMEWWLALGAVTLLGLQTSISPCPLTTNIAAISYITRKVSKTRDVLLSGLLYTLGQTLAYVLLAILILSSMLWSGEALTLFLQTRIHGYLGPILIVIGLMFLGWLSFNIGGIQGEKMQRIADTLGLWSALPLGAVFAMAFCPTSAATFLAAIALASQFQSTLHSNILFPAIFGMGTAVPVLMFAGIIALNAQLIGKAFSIMSTIDWWMRTVTGTLFIVVGLWFSFQYVYAMI